MMVSFFYAACKGSRLSARALLAKSNPSSIAALGLAITCSLALTPPAQAQSTTESDTLSSSSARSHPSRGRSVILARPLDDRVPHFLGDIDEHLMSEELVRSMERDYALRLREYSLRNGFYVQSRDSRLQRSYMGTPDQEARLRREMAESMQNYMLIRGIPNYLMSNSRTRVIGETYQTAVQMAQSATRVDIRSENSSWAFSSGVNPFTSKGWAKYSNKESTIELFNHFNRSDSLGLLLFTNINRYTPRINYYILRQTIEPAVAFYANRDFEAEFRVRVPLNQGDYFYHLRNYVSAVYRF